MLETVFESAPDTVSLEKAKNWLRLRAKKGAYCPCCKQLVKIYRRPLGSQMARWLIWLVRTWGNISNPRSWVDIKKSPVRGGDYAKLVHWDLCQSSANGDAALRNSGMWRPTQRGIDFVHQRIMVPSHAELYDNRLLGFSDEQISIHDALGKRFNYTELMSAQVTVEVPV